MSNIYDEFGIHFSLYPKQQLFLAHPDFTKDIPGWETPKETMFGGAAGASKSQGLSSLVCTPFGFKTMGEIKIGDMVSNPDGTVAKVIQIHPQGVKDMYKITFSDGATVRCTGDHLWTVHLTNTKNKAKVDFSSVKGSPRAQVLGKVIATESLIKEFDRNPFRKGKVFPITPLPEPIDFKIVTKKNRAELLPVSPYAIGALLGDGCMTRPTQILFYNPDKEIIDHMSTELRATLSFHSKVTYGILDPKKKLRNALGGLGLLGKTAEAKFIPHNYLHAPIEDRWALLQGLMDTDGCGGKSNRSEITYKTISEQLGKDVKFLVESLGGRCTVTKCDSHYVLDGVRHEAQDIYYCYIVLPDATKAFRLTRKKNKAKTVYMEGVSPLGRRMISVEPDGQEEAQCITVDHPNGLYITDNFVVTHNSFALRAISVILALECPGVNIYLFRQTYGELASNHMLGPNGYRAWLATAIKKRLVRIDSSANIIYFKNGPAGGYEGGSQIFLRHLQHEKDMFIYQGAEIHILMMDEATHFSPESYYFLRSRVRLGSWSPPEKWKGYFPRILLGSNPGGRMHSLLKYMFVDFVDKANPFRPKWAPADDGGMLRQYIPGTVYDNPALLEEDPGYIDRLKGLGSPELVKAMLEGNWDIVAGGMFDDVWDSRYTVMPAFKVPPNWYINRAFDWGSAVPFACLWFAESNGEEVTLADGSKMSYPRGTLFVIEELYGNNPIGKNPDAGILLSNQDIGYRIRETENNSPVLRNITDRILMGPADNQIFNIMNNDTMARGINAGYWGTDMRKDVDIFFRSDKTSGSRVKRWGLMRDRFQAVLNLRDGKPMENAGLIVFSNCYNTIRTLPTLPRKPTDPEDIMDGVPDHLADVIGYRCLQRGGGLGRVKVKFGG